MEMYDSRRGHKTRTGQPETGAKKEALRLVGNHCLGSLLTLGYLPCNGSSAPLSAPGAVGTERGGQIQSFPHTRIHSRQLPPSHSNTVRLITQHPKWKKDAKNALAGL